MVNNIEETLVSGETRRAASWAIAAGLVFAVGWGALARGELPAGQAKTGAKPTPATQPTSGPGGAEYKHKGVTARKYGEGGTAYWIFEPADPKPAEAPLIIFNHGWSAMQPAPYGAWIDHTVMRGNIVVYPVYQASLRTPPHEFTANAIAAVKDAIDLLGKEDGHVRPDLQRVAVVGHSMGGPISANMLVLAGKNGLPQPKAAMCVQPGGTQAAGRIAFKLEDLSQVPKDTLLLTIVGDSDLIARDIDAKRIFNETKQVPAENKNYIVLVSDDHGVPAIKANHFAPVAMNSKYSDRNAAEAASKPAGAEGELPNIAAGEHGVDALDFYGTWKLLDALTDAAFYGKNRRYALGNTPEQRFMGRWSDGVPIKELQVLDKP